jgi:predicted dinucleotide-binding enzyme
MVHGGTGRIGRSLAAQLVDQQQAVVEAADEVRDEENQSGLREVRQFGAAGVSEIAAGEVAPVALRVAELGALGLLLVHADPCGGAGVRRAWWCGPQVDVNST